jgi:hypothetical protein
MTGGLKGLGVENKRDARISGGGDSQGAFRGFQDGEMPEQAT